MREIFLWSALIFLMFPAEAALIKQGDIKLSSVKILDDGTAILKTYTSSDDLQVSYTYGESILDEDYANVLHLSLVNNYVSLLPVDIDKTGFIVGGDMDETVQKFRIPKTKLSPGCDYVGDAVVRLSDMRIWVPEYPSEYVFGAKVVNVLHASDPKIKCQNVD